MDAFIERMGTTRTGFNEMRRRGFVARRDGQRRVLVTAEDFLAYVLSLPVADLDPKGDDQE